MGTLLLMAGQDEEEEEEERRRDKGRNRLMPQTYSYLRKEWITHIMSARCGKNPNIFNF